MDYCMTKECTKAYLDKLKDGIAEYMNMPVNLRSTEAIESMVECWERINGMYNMMWPDDPMESHGKLTDEDAIAWNKAMRNVDGTVGGRWLISDTSNLGKPDNVTDWEWNALMNMMFSDYCEVANKYGVGSARFYADMARAFINDVDGHEDKLARYYHYVAKSM